jgi:D-serine dehydratase
MMDLGELDRQRIDDCQKGIPGGTPAFALADVGAQGWNLLREDLPLPLAVLRESALEHNGAWMRDFLARTGVEIAPHGKTSMSPQLFARQLALGAWAITVSNTSQLQVCRKFRVPRVLYANQLVGRQAVRYVLEELERDPDFDFYCLVDSRENVDFLRAWCRARDIGRPLQLLLELGFPGGRTGCRTVAQALDVARAVREGEPYLALRGVEAFEGIIPLGPNGYEGAAKVRDFLETFGELARRCDEDRLFAEGEVVLTAGGSAFFDLVADSLRSIHLSRPSRVVVRSGCYLTHDVRMYHDAFEQVLERSEEARSLGEGLRPALEVWGYVQSMPESGRALLTVGKRDCSFDYKLPEPRLWYRPGTHEVPQPLSRHTVTQLNDQHAYVDYEGETPLRVGDMVALGISHPCTTFDKWQLVMVLNDSYDVVGAVRTFF